MADFKDQVAALRPNIELIESEETWDYITESIQVLTELCQDGYCEYPDQVVPVIKSIYRPINSAMKSERTRLSGAGMDLVSAVATGLNGSFEPLLPLFLPTILSLCGRPNKVVLNRAKACVVTIIETTQSPTVLPFLLQYIKDKSTTLRLAAAECSLTAVNALDPLDLEKEARVQDIESLIKSTATDANAEIRKIGRGIFSSYKILFPGRVDRFTDPLTPTIKKYLDIKKKPLPPPLPAKQPPPRIPANAVSNPPADRAPPPRAVSQPTHKSTSSVDRPIFAPAPSEPPPQRPPLRRTRTKTHTSSNSRERNAAAGAMLPPPVPAKAKEEKASTDKPVTAPPPPTEKSTKSSRRPDPEPPSHPPSAATQPKRKPTAPAEPVPVPPPKQQQHFTINTKDNAPMRVLAKSTSAASETNMLPLRQRTVSGPGRVLVNTLSKSSTNAPSNEANPNPNSESTPPIVMMTGGAQRVLQSQQQRPESRERVLLTEQERKAQLVREVQARLNASNSATNRDAKRVPALVVVKRGAGAESSTGRPPSRTLGTEKAKPEEKRTGAKVPPHAVSRTAGGAGSSKAPPTARPPSRTTTEPKTQATAKALPPPPPPATSRFREKEKERGKADATKPKPQPNARTERHPPSQPHPTATTITMRKPPIPPMHSRSKSVQQVQAKAVLRKDKEKEKDTAGEKERPSSKASVRSAVERPASKASARSVVHERPGSKASVLSAVGGERPASKASVRSQPPTRPQSQIGGSCGGHTRSAAAEPEIQAQQEEEPVQEQEQEGERPESKASNRSQPQPQSSPPSRPQSVDLPLAEPAPQVVDEEDLLLLAIAPLIPIPISSSGHDEADADAANSEFEQQFEEPHTPPPKPTTKMDYTVAKTPITSLLQAIENGFAFSPSPAARTRHAEPNLNMNLFGNGIFDFAGDTLDFYFNDKLRPGPPQEGQPRKSLSTGDLRGFAQKQERGENANAFGLSLGSSMREGNRGVFDEMSFNF